MKTFYRVGGVNVTDSVVLNHTWIPCNVTFPKQTDWYLVTVECPEGIFTVEETYFSTIYGWILNKNSKVHAWMPKPKAYEYDGYSEFHEKTIEEMIEEGESE